MPEDLLRERDRFVELRRRLLQAFPDLDDQTLADTLEGATNMHEALAALIRSAVEDECLAKALKDRLAQMRARLGRLDKRVADMRAIAAETMALTHVRKLVQPDFTASLRQGVASVEINDETSIPIDFLIPQPAKPDRRAILDALSAGEAVPGAILCPPKTSLTIRSQ